MKESKFNKKTDRKPIYLDNYYTDQDYEEVLEKLPDIIKEAKKKSGEVLEPTIHEKRAVVKVILEFIGSKDRPIYGGTALNEALLLVNKNDAIYDDYIFSDIEFYSPSPVVDLVELCNILHNNGFKYVQGRSAQHEETFSIFVNFQLYCDITYVAKRVYNGIKTFKVNGIKYVDPHFMLIDYLRMVNQPLTAAEQRWEKAFKRMFVLLKNYPLEYYTKNINLSEPTIEIQRYHKDIKEIFIMDSEIQKSCLLTGFDAYNFYIKYAINDKSINTIPSRVHNKLKLDNFLTNVPYLEFVSVNYKNTVEKLYNFIKNLVPNPKEIVFEEYFPLFQFTGYSILFKYKDLPIAKIYEADNFCVPSVKTNKGYMFVSYQYLLMSLIINKFRSHLDKDREMYFNYGYAISNLVTTRNEYLTKKNLGVINNSIFSEFRIPCVGTTQSYIREAQLRYMESSKHGKKPFKYEPRAFFNSSKESQEKFDPNRYPPFKNTSGNIIMNSKNMLFVIDEHNNIIENINDKNNDTVGELESNDRLQKSLTELSEDDPLFDKILTEFNN